MDEIPHPDSSRYFLRRRLRKSFQKGEAQKQLSKEFVREWLMDNNFQGKKVKKVPEMTKEIVRGISERYIELFENITGEKFVKKADTKDILQKDRKERNKLLSKQVTFFLQLQNSIPTLFARMGNIFFNGYYLLNSLNLISVNTF